MKWYPMKTAPRDGSYFLAYVKVARKRHFHVVYYRTEEVDGVVRGYFEGAPFLESTRKLDYWTPLFEPTKFNIEKDPNQKEETVVKETKKSWFVKWILEPLLAGAFGAAIYFGALEIAKHYGISF